MSSETATPKHTSPASLRPGAELKRQREAAGRALDEVGKDTLITRSKLAALEEDDYGRVGSNTFVVGYIRKYAKWLNIDADPLVQAFEKAVSDQPETHEGQLEAQKRKRQSVKPPRQRRSLPNFPLLWIVAALLAVWVLVALLFSQDKDESNQNRSDASNEPATTEMAPATRSSPESASDLSDGTEAVTESATQESADPIADVTVPNPGSATEETAAPAVKPAEPNLQSETPEDATLVMHFSGDCWVEVSDANGKMLFARLQQAGDNLQLSGQAPFSVMLGNARVVDLQVDGRPVNTNPGPNRDTMRLTVSP